MIDLDWIEPGRLAAGPLPLDGEDVQGLCLDGIRAIVTLTEAPLTVQRGVTPDLLGILDLRVLHAPIPDGLPPEPKRAAAIVRFMQQAIADSRPVYLHCHAGIGRTGTLLHAYYLHNGLDLNAAKALIAERRPMNGFYALTLAQRRFLEQYAPSPPEIG
ncbi:MAG: dual specificity protein phosphatase family protein [Anaerolineae bacterium]|nr:dual specificity protein phosphatase family protein [Anaerolineae bacterium]